MILVLSTAALLGSCQGGGATSERGRSASLGPLDAAFNTTGIVTTTVGTIRDYGQAVAIQSDGKIVVAGYADNGSQDVFTLVRYNTNGSLDKTFNTTGIVTTPIGTSDADAFAVAIQSDGKIVVAGDCDNGSQYVFALVRYTP